jgi:hypothetical protein
MTNVKAINDERLGRWKVKLIRQHATPIFLLGVGHDHKNGQLVILCTEDRTDQELLLFLEGAANELRKQMSQKN